MTLQSFTQDLENQMEEKIAMENGPLAISESDEHLQFFSQQADNEENQDFNLNDELEREKKTGPSQLVHES